MNVCVPTISKCKYCPSTGCAAEADVVFLIDSSSSVGERHFQTLLRFLSTTVQDMNIDTGHLRVGVLSYNSDIYVHFHLNQYNSKEALLEAIQTIPYNYGSTNTADALKAVRNQMFRHKNGDRGKAPNILVIVTDGTPNVNVRRTLQEARKVKETGIHIMVVGIGLAGDTSIKQLVSAPVSDNTLLVARYKQLKNIRKKVLRAICQGTSITIF